MIGLGEISRRSNDPEKEHMKKVFAGNNLIKRLKIVDRGKYINSINRPINLK